MTSAGPEIPTLTFSTEDYSELERMAVWREFYGRKVARTEIEPLADRKFISGGTVHLLPDLTVYFGRCSGARYRMTRELIANDDIAMVLNDVPLWRAEQLGREAVLARGDAVLMTGAEPGDFLSAAPGPAPSSRWSSLQSLCVPRQALSHLVPNLEDALVRPIPVSVEAMRLLRGYLSVIESSPAIASPAAWHLVVTHIHDLIALAVGASRDAAEAARGRGLAAARLREAKSIIEKELDDANLAIGAVAGRLGVSPRYLQMLFDRDGATFSEYLLGRRLLRVHRRLSDPRFAGFTVSELAFDAGFGGLAHFNRTFRRAYGATPSDVRASRRG